MDQQELKRLARLGAAARLAELNRERAALLRNFPGLRAASDDSSPAEEGTGRGGRRRRRGGMSAAARRAVSVRMRKYWAARRKAKAAKS
jgi:hypothetical protein